jgi:hypothetical protein
MKLVSVTMLSVLLAAGALIAGKVYDWKNLSPDDIASLKAERRAFYEAEALGKQEAIREQQPGKDVLVDGNQNDYDVRYYGLHLNLDFSSQTIIASVDYQIRSVINGLSAVDLNLRDELTVDSVKVEGTTAAFTHTNHLLHIVTPTSYAQNDEFDMSVHYHGTPYYDGAAGMRFMASLGSDMCWTKGTPFRSRYWWPSKDYPIDKPDSIDLYIEMPADHELASNGVQISSTPVGADRKLVHHKHRFPITTFNVAFCCTHYDIDVQTWNYDGHAMPFYSYALPGNPAAMTAFKTYGPQSLTVLSDHYGTYPFVDEKMGNADFGWSGAMEHQTCCMYNTGFHDEWVIAHETSHQWWGNMISCKTFNHIWLSEGFATYSEPLYFEATSGSTAYFDYLQSMRYFGPGSIYVENLTYEEIYDGDLSYNKAGWVLHMLRGAVGDSAFFTVLRDWGNSEFRFGSATTEDFIAVASSSLGQDIGWFVNEWIYGQGNPEYEISRQCKRDTLEGGYNLDFYIRQVQTYGTCFKMPIRTTFVTAGADLDTVIWNEGVASLYRLHFADSVTNVVFDPQEWILRKLTAVPFTMHIVTVTLPDAVLDRPYSQSLVAVGGQSPYHWRLMGGDLPIGMSFDTATATIQGVPTWPATYYFTIQASTSDIPALVDTRGFAIRVVESDNFCGDADANGFVNISDAVYLIAYIFSGGPAPNPLDAGDADCNGFVNISDAVYLINYIFASGPAPCAAC